MLSIRKSISSLFDRVGRGWEDYSERDLKYFFRAYFSLLFLRFSADYNRMLLEVRYSPEFQNIFWLIPERPSPILHQTVLIGTLGLLLLCLVRRIRPFALIGAASGLFWLVTIHESFYAQALTGRFFHARLAVIYPLFGILLWEWIRILKRRLKRPEGRMEFAVPILITQWTLGIMYLGSVVSRLLGHGYPGWADGVTLQAILLDRWIAFGGDGFFMIKSYWLSLIAQHLVMLLEGGFIITVFFPALAPIAVVSGLIFHLASEWLMYVTYIDFAIILYSAYFNPIFFRSIKRMLEYCYCRSFKGLFRIVS